MSDGHRYISDAYAKGVRNFIVTQHQEDSSYIDANFLLVEDSLVALQLLATYHRKNASLDTIGITGSNGKTIIKEWLYQMMYDKYHIVKSPKSYNSQIGMALSILNIEPHHDFGIFEAGISTTAEMTNHLSMLSPRLGIFTNIGAAHDEGFTSRNEKIQEKALLFKHSEIVIIEHSQTDVQEAILAINPTVKCITWGSDYQCDIVVLENNIHNSSRIVSISYGKQDFDIHLRNIDSASYQNYMHCIAMMLHLGVPLSELQWRIDRVSNVEMRMELTEGIYGSMIINDAYNADLDSLKIALEFTLQHEPNRKKIAILGEFEQSGKQPSVITTDIIKLVENFDFETIYFVGTAPVQLATESLTIHFVSDKKELSTYLSDDVIKDKAILIKGSRNSKLEKVARSLSVQSHSAELSINLNNLDHNLRAYNTILTENTKIIAIIKASAYGSGSAEIARLLIHNGVNKLAVAFTDEGVQLRKAGISAPIMVLNPDVNSTSTCINYKLEPEIYDIQQLRQVEQLCAYADKSLHINLKVDTGMHRLGLQENDLANAIELLNASKHLQLETVYSHLASAEDTNDDAYTERQFALFDRMCTVLKKGLDHSFDRHILNSAGISRFPQYHYEYVRLGIGMYGIAQGLEIQQSLKKVHSLTAHIIQLKEIKKGESIGYNRKTILSRDSKIGVLNIGYADGISRALGNGKFSFIYNGHDLPILGNVCMDLIMLDVTDAAEIQVGSEIELFGEQRSIEEFSTAAGTIPYEVLSRISKRVKRKFVRN